MCISRRALNGKKYLFWDIHNFHFPLKSKMATKSGENWNFSPRHRILLHYPVGQKFARNCSISYHFEDIFTVLFSTKIQDGRQKWRNWNFSHLHRILLYYPVGQKFARNRSISYDFDIFTLFHFPLKSKMPDFEIFTLFHFPLKSKMHYSFRDICDFFHISTKSSNKVPIAHLYIEQQVWNWNMSQFTKK